jgi:hypothetical protein
MVDRSSTMGPESCSNTFVVVSAGIAPKASDLIGLPIETIAPEHGKLT